MKTIMISGLGEVSRHVAAQISVCEEAGADELVDACQVSKALIEEGFTDKEVRQAIFTLTTHNVLRHAGVGSYVWL
mgnify:CR=1 FL=1